ncbi:putative membrane protein YdjX (TVP38/TMEM64 family) [Tepidamorphus gemmatus]|uniref:TVP38/TMEM64 family membrane protein n=1 Tax=Tepidamorphus gemmatus TaxID=747076 RepID=A0A4R3MAD3_9HYPH|nr:TVP38/TMEM64 family protein [Tepidamorphus gemmatus]TCT08787.1 putative membrane protein YdjX (TVP38/TMEM64 family) [Tepidamorphus gemmatus]
MQSRDKVDRPPEQDPAATLDGFAAGPAVATARMARRWLPLAGVVVVAALAVWQGWHRHLTLENLLVHEATLRGLVSDNYALALAGYALAYVGLVALSLPGGLVLTLAGGFLFGWLIGGAVTVLAATIGATAIFLIARSSLGEVVARAAGPRLAGLARGFRTNALSYLLFLRLVPIFPFWLVNIAPALLGVRLSTYVVATLVGIMPGTFAFAFAGEGLHGVLAAQREAYEVCLAAARAAGAGPTATCSLSFSPGSLVTPELVAALFVLGLLALLPVVAQKGPWRRPGADGRS